MQARVNPNERANQTLTPPDPSKTYFRLVPKGEEVPRIGEWVESILPYEGSSAATGFVTLEPARHWTSGACALVVECEGDGMAVYDKLGDYAVGTVASEWDEVPVGFIYPRTRVARVAFESELNSHGVYTRGVHQFQDSSEYRIVATDGTARLYFGGTRKPVTTLAFGGSSVSTHWSRAGKVYAHDRSTVCASVGNVVDRRHGRVHQSFSSVPQLSVVPDVIPANQTETRAVAQTVAAAVQVPVAASTTAPTVLDDIVRLAVQVREAETALAACRTRLSDALAAMSAPAAPVATPAPAEPAPVAVPQEVVHAPPRKGPRVTVTHPPRSAKSR